MVQPNYLFLRIDNAQISMCERLTEFWGAKKIQSSGNFRLAFCLVVINVTDHRIGDQVQRCPPTVSDYRVRQMRDRGLRAIAELSSLPDFMPFRVQTKLIPFGCIHMVCEQADNR